MNLSLYAACNALWLKNEYHYMRFGYANFIGAMQVRFNNCSQFQIFKNGMERQRAVAKNLLCDKRVTN